MDGLSTISLFSPLPLETAEKRVEIKNIQFYGYRKKELI